MRFGEKTKGVEKKIVSLVEKGREKYSGLLRRRRALYDENKDLEISIYNRKLKTYILKPLSEILLTSPKNKTFLKPCALYAHYERSEKKVWDSNISGFSKESGENSQRQQISEDKSLGSDRNYLRDFFYELSARARYREGTECDNIKKEEIAVLKEVIA